MQYLVIGSSVTDFFTQISPGDHASVSNKTVTFHLGDKIPIQITEQAMGGNGMNVSIGLTRLGLHASFYTYLGNDSYSHDIEAFLEKEGVRVYAEKDGETSDISFILDMSDDRIIFSHHPVRDHGFSAPENQQFDKIFLSSVGDHWEEAYKKVLTYATYSQTPLIFSPGSRQLNDINDTFFSALHASESLLINKDEASEILDHFGTSYSDISSIIHGLAQLGPKVISITDGGQGAYGFNGADVFHISTLSKEKAPEKTGAGDAYASGFLAALAHNHPIEEGMRWGSLNAHMVMQKIGAQNGLITQDELLRLLEKHDTFKATKVA
ncbi:MAG TPA: carbohydrate kinase family protein [Candidatus Levybacteria bacterium]|nr:carbohydrate kinase family protein [Candidatus Levybacteria bacterium]